MSDLNGKPALNAALNSPQALTAALTSASSFSATMAPGIPLGGGGSYILPPATATVLGGVKIGSNVTVQPDGTISVAAPGISGVGVQLLGANIGTQPTLNFSVVQPGMSFGAGNDAANSRINLQFGADVVKVFGRTGLVVGASGDYTAAQVTNAVDTTQAYANPAWITSLAWSKITGAPAFLVSPLTAKGDIHTFTTVDARLAVGTNGQVLTADSTQASGIKWATPAAAPVTSVFTRTGAVAATTGDYTAAQVTNAVDSTQAYANPSWLTAVPWSILSGSPSAAQIGGIQTPWLQNIAGAGFKLLNAGAIGVGSSLATAPDVGSVYYIQVGPDTVGTSRGQFIACSNQTTVGNAIGEFAFVNFANATAEKRLAYITCTAGDTTGTNGILKILCNLSGTLSPRWQLNANGTFFAGTQIGGNDLINFYTDSGGGFGLGVINSNAVGGSMFMRSIGNVNYLQSGNNSGAVGNSQNLAFSSNAQSSPTTWMFIQASNGNVGIGANTSPGYALHVGTNSLAQDARIGLNCGNGSAYRMWSAGVKYGGSTTTPPNYGFTIRDESAAAEPKERFIIDWNSLGVMIPLPGASNAGFESAMINDSLYILINEASNLLTFRVKYSTGLFKQGTIAVA